MGRPEETTVRASVPVKVVAVGGVTDVFAPDTMLAVIVVCPGESAVARP
jgi:hypothetical protein